MNSTRSLKLQLIAGLGIDLFAPDPKNRRSEASIQPNLPDKCLWPEDLKGMPIQDAPEKTGNLIVRRESLAFECI